MVLSLKQKVKLDLLKAFKGIKATARNEKGETYTRDIKPYTVQRIAWMTKLSYEVTSKYFNLDDGSKYVKPPKKA